MNLVCKDSEPRKQETTELTPTFHIPLENGEIRLGTPDEWWEEVCNSGGVPGSSLPKTRSQVEPAFRNPDNK